MVDKFFNSKHFSYTLAYLFRVETVSPWAFFSSLACFWQEQGYSGRAQRQVLLYEGLWRFIKAEALMGSAGQEAKTRYRREQKNLRDLLTLDYYLSGTGGLPAELPTGNGAAGSG